MRIRVIPVDMLGDILHEDWVDPDRHPFVEEGKAYVPVKTDARCDCIMEERSPYQGRGYQRIGDIALVHGKRPDDREIRQIRDWCEPRGILWIRGYAGIERVPDCEVLWGAAGEATHREAGIIYYLDPTRVMFAQGNREEKARLAACIRSGGKGSRVADMFAGIGYFSLPAARAGARVHAMEINPAAFRYLCRNIAVNNLKDRIIPEYGDCRTLLNGKYDRIIMGHFDAAGMLPVALGHSHTGTVIHLHSLGDVSGEVRERVGEFGFRAEIASRRVKKYAPGVWHMVQDVKLS